MCGWVVINHGILIWEDVTVKFDISIQYIIMINCLIKDVIIW